MNLTIDGVLRDLRHLESIRVVLPGKGRDGSDLRIAVHFGLHAVSRKCERGEAFNMRDENGQSRVFCEERYAFSLGLPEIAKRMVEQKYYCWESKDRNRHVNYAVLDFAPGRITEAPNGHQHVIYFYLMPSSHDDVDVNLNITSCHAKTISIPKNERRFDLHVVLRKCFFNQKRMP